ncbi:S1/P1 nuclease [Maricaulis sp. CAU 1757]
MSVWVRGALALGVATAALATTSAPAAAWGYEGHKIVCELAYRHLTETARAEIDRLVAGDDEFENFADTCSWADEVRRTTHRHTYPWHFINQDRDDPVIDPEDCAEDGCITEAIDLHAGILGDTSRSDADRLEALKFLGHWLGDIHQPLHVSIHGDRGGNDIQVLWRGERHTSLHRVWDSEIMLDYMSASWPWAGRDERVAMLTEELAAGLPLDGVTVYATLDAIGWAQESHDIVRSRDFAYYWADAERPIAPGEHYYETHLDTVHHQLQQGGVRLAGLINTLIEGDRLAQSAATPASTALD